MKALLRKKGETVTEADGLVFINWTTGAPLTNSGWSGGPYQMVDNYVEVADGAIYDVAVYPEPEDPTPAADGATYGCTDPSAASQPADAPAQDPLADTIVIDGVTYIRKSQD